jgi:uncharacterized protein (TIGR02996 family)
VEEELALLRGIAENVYDRTRLLVYADWLEEHERYDEAARMRYQYDLSAPSVNGNSISVGELIGHLMSMPVNAPVIYRNCSDWSELQRDEVSLHKAEDKKICWRPQNGYMDYEPLWFSQERVEATERAILLQGEDSYTTSFGPRRGEKPRFVTVCCFPGN